MSSKSSVPLRKPIAVEPPHIPGDAPLLDVRGLTVSYRTRSGKTLAVRSLDLRLNRGSVLGLVGESGCGKTTVGLSIPRLLPPESNIEAGEVIFDGMDLVHLREHELRRLRGRRISLISQNAMTGLNPVYSIKAQVVEALRAHEEGQLSNEHRDTLVTDLLELVGLPDPRTRLRAFPHELSGGMRQRVMTAMAIALDPDLLVADEPTTALDVTVQAQILWLLSELKRKIGMAMIYVTHDLVVASNMCDEIAVMYAGQIVELATSRDLFANPMHPYTRGLLGTIPTAHWRARRLEAIHGQPPQLHGPLTSCAFVSRCPVEEERCLRGEPPLREVTGGHAVRCVRYCNDEQR